MTLTLDLHWPLLHSTPPAAVFSEDRRYRYRLTRQWDPDAPALAVVGTNPSKADEHRHDPTTRNIEGLAKASGYGSFDLFNVSAGVSTDPKKLAEMDDPVGPDNDAYLDSIADRHDVIVLAWGNNADPQRARDVAGRLWRAVRATGGSLAVWGWTGRGQPRHPLYLRYDTPLQCLTASAMPEMDLDSRWWQLIADTRGLDEERHAAFSNHGGGQNV